MKYRAWDEEVKHMYYQSSHVTLGMNGVCINLQTGKQLVPLPWIEIHDRKQRKVYVGDILCCRGDGVSDNEPGKNYSVEYCGGRDYPAFDLKDHPNVDCNALSYYLACGSIEVVGSIYENPELKNV
jgi:hypothetical protein